MPLYEYECQVCRKHTEKIQKFSDPEITTCPHCGGELKRVLSAPAFALKGGGWYADGYGSAKPAPSGDAAVAKTDGGKAEGGKAEGGKSDAGKSDSGKSAGGKADVSSAAPPPAPAAAPTASAPSPSSSSKD